MLRDEILGAASDDWAAQEAVLTELREKFANVEKSIYRQSLRLEEHDDPDHPVVAAAAKRIEDERARCATAGEVGTGGNGARPSSRSPTFAAHS
jgi:hypothetical protein